MKKDNRFEVIHKDGSPFSSFDVVVLVDKQTGVNYLTWQSGFAGGITPLLDENGKPVITK